MIRALLNKIRYSKTLVPYFFVGGVAAFVDLLFFILLAKLAGLNYFWVGAAGFIIATAVNYILSVRFVFTSGARHTRNMEIMFVFLVSGLGLLLHQMLLYHFVEYWGVEIVLSKILATAIVFLWNYSARKFFIFSHKSVKENEL